MIRRESRDGREARRNEEREKREDWERKQREDREREKRERDKRELRKQFEEEGLCKRNKETISHGQVAQGSHKYIFMMKSFI